MINKVILIGNLGRDPELRSFESGSSISKFSVATNESYLDKSGQWQTNTEWHDIVAWRRLSEYAQKNLRKGSLVYIEGKLKHRKYQDSEGNDKYITEIEARILRLLEKRDSALTDQSQGYNPEDSSKLSEPSNSGIQQGQVEEDDLPF